MVKRLGCSLLGLLVSCVLFAGLASVSAAAPGPAWTIDAATAPSSGFSLGDSARCTNAQSAVRLVCDTYRVTAANAGGQATDGSTVTLTDTVPAGLEAHGVAFFWSGTGEENLGFLCAAEGGSVRCSFPLPLAPDETLRMVVSVAVQPGAAATVTNTASVSGGGAAEASRSVQSAVSSAPPVFGVSALSSSLITGLGGAPDTQAGAHPYEWTTTIDLNNEVRQNPVGESNVTSAKGDLRDVAVDLPLGFLGSAQSAPECTLAQLSSAEGGSEGCPLDTRVGHILTEPPFMASLNSGIYNMVPEYGVAAELGFRDIVGNSHVLYARVVPTPAGYVLRASSLELPQIPLTEILVQLYGNPAERDGTGNTPVAFLTNPSDCSGEPLTTGVHMDMWQSPGRFNADGTADLSDPNWVSAGLASPAVTGCDLLRFDPSISVQPDTTVADSPSGLTFDLRVPQNEDPSTLATPPLRDAVLSFPVGLTVDPSAANGLGACSLAQIGLGSASGPSCPDSSKIGAVELSTPLLAGVLQGSVYLAAQEQNPFHSLLAAYIVVDDPATGVVIKIPGEIKTDAHTGQLTGVFDNAPQFPFSELKLTFFGGRGGVFSTPAQCGSYTTTSSLTPWSAPDSGPAATPSDSFQVTSGANGAACGSEPFSPVFSAGTTTNQAGAFSPLSVTFSRQDGEQTLGAVTLKTPPGLLGLLRTVPLCGEPQAAQGTCGQESLIGHTTVGAGPGSNPVYIGGQVFLTGPYKGAPFGLSIVVPAIAGPFNLGTVVVRAAISVDPVTAALTVTSDPLPTILQGIPLQVRTVNVTVDRPGFIFNPTDCEPLALTGTVTSTQGAQSQVSSRFQAANCAALAFHPVFAVTSPAKTSRANGAALDVKVSYPQGSQANIHSVAVKLPVQLPARLSTIQQACPEAVFNANPASCDAGSMIGVGTALTPIFKNPVVGPAYLVSHGGAAFPDIDVVLQGEGVTLDLVGHVNISKSGITSATFFAVPDAPISSFELNLPEGPHSGLSAVGSLCAKPLSMPTTITGQNGAVVTQTTKIKVTGCAKPKKKHKAKKRKKAKKGSAGRSGKRG